MIRKKYIKQDITIGLTNMEGFYKELDLFKDGYFQHYDKENLPPYINVGSVIISCSNSSFFYGPTIALDKVYNIFHYMMQGSCTQAAIYNFDKGWLAPLNYVLDTSRQMKFNVPANTSVSVSISVV